MKSYKVKEYWTDAFRGSTRIVFPVGKIFNEYPNWSDECNIALQDPVSGMIYQISKTSIKYYFEEM